MSQWKFSCPSCGQHFSGDFGYCGREITCSVCQTSFTVPSPGSAAPVQSGTNAPGRPQRTTVSLPASIPRFPPRAEPAPVGPRKTSGLALASVICSAGSFILIPFGFIPGIICGHMARKRLAHEPLLGGAGLAKAGLILGYVALGLYLAGALLVLAFGISVAKLLR
jgi:hypothetical protein